MPIEENKAIVRLICDEVFNKGNIAVADEVDRDPNWSFCWRELVEHWISFDRLDLLQRLAVATSPR